MAVTWEELIRQEQKLSDKEWELYQEIGKAEDAMQDTLSYLSTVSLWFQDLTETFEGSQFEGRLLDEQLELSHQVLSIELDWDDQITKLRQEHGRVEDQLEEVFQQKRILAREESL